MANLEIRFQAPLTRPGIKLEKMTWGVGGKGGGGGEIKKKITPGLKVRFEDVLSNGKTFDCNLESPRTKIKLRLLLNMQQPAVT